MTSRKKSSNHRRSGADLRRQQLSRQRSVVVPPNLLLRKRQREKKEREMVQSSYQSRVAVPQRPLQKTPLLLRRLQLPHLRNAVVHQRAGRPRRSEEMMVQRHNNSKKSLSTLLLKKVRTRQVSTLLLSTKRGSPRARKQPPRASLRMWMWKTTSLLRPLASNIG